MSSYPPPAAAPAFSPSLGISATIPDFETEVNQFLKPPVVQDIDLSVDEDNAIILPYLVQTQKVSLLLLVLLMIPTMLPLP